MSNDDREAANGAQPWGMRWRLSTLMLLTALIAVWTAYASLAHRNERVQRELDSLRRVSRDLIVTDPTRYAIVEQMESWYGEDIWQVHLPQPGSYQLKLATSEVLDPKFAPVSAQRLLSAGRHVVELRMEQSPDSHWQITILVDDEIVMHVEEPADWNPGQGSASSGDYTEVSQQDVDQPLCLRQMTFRSPAPDTSEASNEANVATNSPASRRDHTGILLWIER